MRPFFQLALSALGLVLMVGCGKGPDPVAPPAAPAPSAPAAAPSAAPPPAAASASAAPAKAPVATEYPMCGGQHDAKAATSAKTGAVTAQLAPAFLDEMKACGAADAVPKDVLARAGQGVIDAKGDCVFASVGVSCHYHSGSEFVTSSAKAQVPGQGELHCIFPSNDPNSPSVFGGHVTCTDPARAKPPEHASHAANVGESCSPALLQQLDHCASSRCCDEGTLTNPIADLVRDGKNNVRPDFRICEQTLTIDCSLLENMTAHPANSPALGGIAKAVFGVSPSHAVAAVHPAKSK